ncbi:MAG: hypothetical protein ACXABY_16155 [Candidatus Thorarchaeota archaeon]
MTPETWFTKHTTDAKRTAIWDDGKWVLYEVHGALAGRMIRIGHMECMAAHSYVAWDVIEGAGCSFCKRPIPQHMKTLIFFMGLK